MQLLSSALFAAILTLAGCSATGGPPEATAALCATDEGPALWAGKCVDGLAQGNGTATFEDSYIATITGEYDRGVPLGIVRVEYSGGGYYEGGLRDGEPHGFGIDMESRGEGYEGRWIDGFKDGDGIYIRSDGTRISGSWNARRGFQGSWYTDRTTGCQFWWRASADPVGEATWSGPCINGKANGEGIVTWSLSENGTPLKSEVRFRGTIIDGYIQGDGNWHQVQYYSNVVTTSKFDGTWKDGQRTGHGVEKRTSEYRESDSLDKVVVTYEGDWYADEYGGTGRREEITFSRDGRTEKLIEDGMFADNMLNGEGVSVREILYVTGDSFLERSKGKFENRQFRGYGQFEFKRTTGIAVNSGSATYPTEISNGGTGVVNYADGSQFEGEVDATGSPTKGECVLKSVNYSGACVAQTVKTSDWSHETWLVSPNERETLLFRIGTWVN
ncbi:MAG: hypothetical protein IPK75_01180 [Acidobacteria bacterium]|nr:hypothetical protein [Acidobacteriota bacterium]